MNSLYLHCPHENAAGVFCLDSKAQDSIIALGIYFLESGCQHDENIVPYFIKLAKALPKVVWVDDVVRRNPTGKIPVAEKFSFCLNTLLSDIAVYCPQYKDDIIQSQVEILGVLTNMVKTSKENTQLPPIILCKATVPIMLGLARSMARYASLDEKPLLCRIFPKPERPSVATEDGFQSTPGAQRQTSLNQFRSIIPRSMSGSLSVDSSENSPKVSLKGTGSYQSTPYDPSTYFFSKYGSSFNQFPNMRLASETTTKKSRIQFPINHLQSIFAIAKKLLTKDVLEHLDEQACDIYNLHQVKPFGYKSFSETINLVIVSLLKEILQNQTGKKI